MGILNDLNILTRGGRLTNGAIKVILQRIQRIQEEGASKFYPVCPDENVKRVDDELRLPPDITDRLKYKDFWDLTIGVYEEIANALNFDSGNFAFSAPYIDPTALAAMLKDSSVPPPNPTPPELPRPPTDDALASVLGFIDPNTIPIFKETLKLLTKDPTYTITIDRPYFEEPEFPDKNDAETWKNPQKSKSNLSNLFNELVEQVLQNPEEKLNAIINAQPCFIIKFIEDRQMFGEPIPDLPLKVALDKEKYIYSAQLIATAIAALTVGHAATTKRLVNAFNLTEILPEEEGTVAEGQLSKLISEISEAAAGDPFQDRLPPDELLFSKPGLHYLMQKEGGVQTVAKYVKFIDSKTGKTVTEARPTYGLGHYALTGQFSDNQEVPLDEVYNTLIADLLLKQANIKKTVREADVIRKSQKRKPIKLTQYEYDVLVFITWFRGSIPDSIKKWFTQGKGSPPPRLSEFGYLADEFSQKGFSKVQGGGEPPLGIQIRRKQERFLFELGDYQAYRYNGPDDEQSRKKTIQEFDQLINQLQQGIRISPEQFKKYKAGIITSEQVPKSEFDVNKVIKSLKEYEKQWELSRNTTIEKEIEIAIKSGVNYKLPQAMPQSPPPPQLPGEKV